MRRWIAIALISVALVGSAPAQQPQEPMVTFHLTKTMAAKLEQVVGGVKSSEAAYVYVAVQEAIFAQGRAEQQAQVESYNRSVIAQHETKPSAAPAAPPADDGGFPPE